MYSNDVRVANTAAPSFQAKANVTQYGWTDVDQGHYNQLIQYVDECRKIRDELDDKIDYINEILKGISGIDEQVKYVTQKADEVAEDARQVKASVIYIEVTFNRLNTMIAGFDRDYADFSTKYTDFEIKYVDVLLAATDAAESATQAEAWYSKTYDLYLDLKNGQVYRGTWNPATAAYPAHEGTNSVWDVILNVGLDTVNFGGFEWHNGDRLLYILATDAYDQLRTGSGVLSINGKTGAVTMDHTDVGALAVDGVSVATKKLEKPVKIVGKEFDGTGDLDIYPNDIQAVPEGRRINNKMLDRDIDLVSADIGAIALTDAEDTGDKVMRVGGPRDLQIQAALSDATGGAYMNEHPPANPIPGARWFDTNEGRTYLYYVDADSSQWIEENPQSPDIIQTSPIVQKLANDLILDRSVTVESSLPITGGTVNGGITVRDGITITGIGNVQEMVGGFLRCNTDRVMSMDGKVYSFVTSANDAHLCHNAFWDGTDWRKYDNAKPSGYFVVRDTGLQYMVSNAGETNPASHRFEVLSTRNTGFVPFSSVFTANAANGWQINDEEVVCRSFPGGIHFQGIFRRTAGHSTGDNNIGWFSHASCRAPYITYTSSLVVTAGTNQYITGYIERLNGGNNLISNHLDPNMGWIMLSGLIEFK